MTKRDAVSEEPGRERLVAGRYHLLSPLGQGGMGTVWRARDTALHREVAVKEVRAPAGMPASDVERMYTRLEREAWAAARVAHRNVVTVHDVVMEEHRPWIVMEWIRGRSLADLLKAERVLAVSRTAFIGAEVLAALRAAHEAGVVHRDVKPANVLLAEDGRVVLTDFGIAVIEGSQGLTMTGQVVGSPEFLAPESALGQSPGPEADLWSLGVLLYVAVEGRSPFRQKTAFSTLRAIVDEELPPPRRAGSLAPVIEGLLRKDPGERTSAAAVERELRRVADASTNAAAEASRPTGTARPDDLSVTTDPAVQETRAEISDTAETANALTRTAVTADVPLGQTVTRDEDPETAAASRSVTDPRITAAPAAVRTDRDGLGTALHAETGPAGGTQPDSAAGAAAGRRSAAGIAPHGPETVTHAGTVPATDPHHTTPAVPPDHAQVPYAGADSATDLETATYTGANSATGLATATYTGADPAADLETATYAGTDPAEDLATATYPGTDPAGGLETATHREAVVAPDRTRPHPPADGGDAEVATRTAAVVTSRVPETDTDPADPEAAARLQAVPLSEAPAPRASLPAVPVAEPARTPTQAQAQAQAQAEQTPTQTRAQTQTQPQPQPHGQDAAVSPAVPSPPPSDPPRRRRRAPLVTAGVALVVLAAAGTGYALVQGGNADRTGSAAAGAKGSQGAARGSGQAGSGTEDVPSTIQIAVTGSHTTYTGPCPVPDGEAPSFTATFSVDSLPAQLSYRWVASDGTLIAGSWRTLTFPDGGGHVKQDQVSLTTWAGSGRFDGAIGVELKAPLQGTSHTVPTSLTCTNETSGGTQPGQ